LCEVFLKDCCPWKHTWRHITPLSGLKALEIGLSTLLLGESSQDSLKFWAVIKIMQMDRFMEEDVIQGIGRSPLEAI
jgi:hypothetical protein